MELCGNCLPLLIDLGWEVDLLPAEPSLNRLPI
jgi:hypothetical protein